MNRRIFISAVAFAAALVVVIGGWVFSHRASAAAPAPSLPAPNVGIATVRVGPYERSVSAQGRVGPPAGSSAKVAFAGPGIVRAVDVRVGETVTAGTPLAELDRNALGASVDQAAADAAAAAGQYGGGSVPAAALRSAQAKAAVAAAKLRGLQAGGPAAQSDEIGAQQALRQVELKVAADQGTLARQNVLFNGGVVAAKDVQAARNQLASDLADERAARAKVAAAAAGYAASMKAASADYAAALNDVKTAQAQSSVLGAQTSSAGAKLQSARIAYEQGVLRAPNDGVVLAILKHPGEAVDPASPVVEIGPGAANAITLSIPAQTAEQIHPGDPARIVVAQSGQTSRGRVNAVVPAVDPTTQLATVTLTGAPSDTVPGDAVSATIVTGRVVGMIVPSSAIVEDPQSGKTVVFVRKRDGSFDSRAVTVRLSDARVAVVGSGLHAGDRIATQGSYELLAPSGG